MREPMRDSDIDALSADGAQEAEAAGAPLRDEALRREVLAVCDAYGDKGWAKSAMVRRLRAALAATPAHICTEACAHDL